MTTLEAFGLIESNSFSAHVSVASDLDTFLEAARRRPELALLRGSISSTDDIFALIARIEALLAEDFDKDYRHPHDVALAVYFWVLTSFGIAPADAVEVPPELNESLWWSAQLLDQISGEQEETATCIMPANLNPTYDAPPNRSVNRMLGFQPLNYAGQITYATRSSSLTCEVAG